MPIIAWSSNHRNKQRAILAPRSSAFDLQLVEWPVCWGGGGEWSPVPVASAAWTRVCFYACLEFMSFAAVLYGMMLTTTSGLVPSPPLCGIHGRGGSCVPVEHPKSVAVWASYPVKNNYLPKMSHERDTGVKTGNECNMFTASRLAAKPPGALQATLVRAVGWLVANGKFCSCSWNGKHCMFVLSGLQNIEYLLKIQFCLDWEINFRDQPSPVLSFLATVLI